MYESRIEENYNWQLLLKCHMVSSKNKKIIVETSYESKQAMKICCCCCCFFLSTETEYYCRIISAHTQRHFHDTSRINFAVLSAYSVAISIWFVLNPFTFTCFNVQVELFSRWSFCVLEYPLEIHSCISPSVLTILLAVATHRPFDRPNEQNHCQFQVAHQGEQSYPHMCDILTENGFHRIATSEYFNCTTKKKQQQIIMQYILQIIK